MGRRSWYVACMLALACALSEESVLPDITISLRVMIDDISAFPLHFFCTSGTFDLLESVPTNQWSAYFAAWDADYDKGHIAAYWIVRPDGLFHSWDTKFWTKRADWQNNI
ncbi:hypothetical protein RJT34_04296 [Clitoria ternatea]|uniref:S-protein homolog n=1 Tax=Clitoria ternatea TaxID=43366 RepID=A0AAN9KNU5_CLITE